MLHLNLIFSYKRISYSLRYMRNKKVYNVMLKKNNPTQQLWVPYALLEFKWSFKYFHLLSSRPHPWQGWLNTLDQWWLLEGVSCLCEPLVTSCTYSTATGSVLESHGACSPLDPALRSLWGSYTFWRTLCPDLCWGSTWKYSAVTTTADIYNVLCNHGGRGFLSSGWEQAGDDYR